MKQIFYISLISFAMIMALTAPSLASCQNTQLSCKILENTVLKHCIECRGENGKTAKACRRLSISQPSDAELEAQAAQKLGHQCSGQSAGEEEPSTTAFQTQKSF